jgi:hypothetical protein
VFGPAGTPGPDLAALARILTRPVPVAAAPAPDRLAPLDGPARRSRAR